MLGLPIILRLIEYKAIIIRIPDKSPFIFPSCEVSRHPFPAASPAANAAGDPRIAAMGNHYRRYGTTQRKAAIDSQVRKVQNAVCDMNAKCHSTTESEKTDFYCSLYG